MVLIEESKLSLFMKIIYLLIISLWLSISLFSCDTTKADSNPVTNPQAAGELITITHFNVIITPDLSNRLQKPKSINDTRIVGAVLEEVLPVVINHKRKTHQKDRYQVSFISNKSITQYKIKTDDLRIGFDHFKGQLERIDYIKDIATPATLSGDRNKFLSEFDRIASAAAKAPDGADIWTYFNKGIDNTLLMNKIEKTEYAGRPIVNQHRNIMILLTDGYIEASMFGEKACATGNQCYYLSGERIKSFRNAFKQSGMPSVKEFYDKNNYGIVPANNANLKDLEVLVLQMEDRSLNNAGNATVYPTDMEIMELFWSDWLEKSQVKRFELRPVVASDKEIEQIVSDFIGL